MNAQDIIDRIDPYKEQCPVCGRYRDKEQLALTFYSGRMVCTDRLGCDSYVIEAPEGDLV